MEQKKVIVTKDGITKKVLEKDIKDYVACGWTITKTTNPYDYVNTILKK